LILIILSRCSEHLTWHDASAKLEDGSLFGNMVVDRMGVVPLFGDKSVNENDLGNSLNERLGTSLQVQVLTDGIVSSSMPIDSALVTIGQKMN